MLVLGFRLVSGLGFRLGFRVWVVVKLGLGVWSVLRSGPALVFFRFKVSFRV